MKAYTISRNLGTRVHINIRDAGLLRAFDRIAWGDMVHGAIYSRRAVYRTYTSYEFDRGRLRDVGMRCSMLTIDLERRLSARTKGLLNTLAKTLIAMDAESKLS